MDGTECIGCGVQEEFRNCADISIGSGDDKDRKTQNDNKETSEPLVTESNIHPRFRTQWTFAPNPHKEPSTTTASPVISKIRQPEAPTFSVDHLWSKTQFVRPRISIDMNQHREPPSTPKPAPRISFLEPLTTTESPVVETTTVTSMEARLQKIRKLQRLAALAIQMKTLLNTLRHLPVFQNLNLGILDKELMGQKEAPWNNLARPTVTEKPKQSRTFPWESGMSLNQIKSKPVTKSTTSKSSAHILRIPPSRVSSRFNYPILPPPNPILMGQFRKEKTRTVTLSSGNDQKNEDEVKPTESPKEEKENVPLYKNEFNVISPESLEGEVSIKDWYKKIVKLMVKKNMPVAEIKKMVDRLKQIKDVHKTQPTTMLEKLRNSEMSLTESNSDNAAISDNSLSSQPTTSPTTNVVYPEVERRPAAPVNTASRNMLYPDIDRQQQRARDISAIPPNINTVRGRPGRRGSSANNPYVDHSEDNQLTPNERSALSVKLRNFMELNPQFRVPFGAVFH